MAILGSGVNYEFIGEKPFETKGDSKLRFLVLFLSAFVSFGSYYCYDNPAALQVPIEDALGINSVQFNLLYTVYSTPNIILPLFGGIIVDRLGALKAILLFFCFVALGQAVFAMGISNDSYAVAIAGRSIYGIGGESLTVANSAILVEWFAGKEVALAMGINLTLARMGSVLNDNISPYLKQHVSLDFAVWFGLGLLGLCLIGIVVLFLVDRRVSRMCRNDNTAQEEGAFDWRVLGTFGIMFWLIVISCFVVYSAILPFNNNASDFLQTKYGYSETQAGAIMGIPFIISAIGSPILGFVVDRIGQKAKLLLGSAACLLLAHGLMAATMVTPKLTLVILGTSYTIYAAAMWPAVSDVVDDDTVGTAYGLTTAVQNCGLAGVPLIAGAIKDHYGGYTQVEIMYCAFSLLGIVVGVLLNVYDKKHGGVLNNVPEAKTINLKETVTERSP